MSYEFLLGRLHSERCLQRQLLVRATRAQILGYRRRSVLAFLHYVDPAGFPDVHQEREMSRIDQGIFTCICIKPPEQVVLTTGMKMHSRFVEQQHASLKGAAAVVHEPQIKREEPLESARLLF